MIAILEIVNTLLNAKKNGDIDFGDALELFMKVKNSDNSVATYARNNVCQFPLLCSTSLSLDACMRTAQILEQLYTVYIRMVITNNLDVIDLTSGENKAKLIHKLHQNDRPNYGIPTSSDIGRTFTDVLNSESVKIPYLNNYHLKKTDLQKANKELLKPYLENFNLGLLNGDNENSNLFTLNEAYDDGYDDDINSVETQFKLQQNTLNNIENQIKERLENSNNYKNLKDEERKQIANQLLSLDKDGDIVRFKDATGHWQTIDDKELISLGRMHTVNMSKMQTLSKTMESLINGSAKRKIAMQYGVSATRADSTIRKNNELEPSLLEIDVTYNNANMMKTTKIAVGVKTIIHKIKSEEMRYYLSRSLIEEKRLFKFFQWTTGEIKFLRDFVLDLSNTKDQAITDRLSVKWWRHLRTRKTASKIRAIGGNDPFLPNATVVFSREDIELIKLNRHLDLMNDTKLASKLMDIYFLLHLVIVDESDDMIYLFTKHNDVWESYKFNKLANDIAQSLKQNTVLNLR